MNEIQDIYDGYEYLSTIYPFIVRVLDFGEITIDANHEQIREAEKDLLVTTIEAEKILLLDVYKALEQIILDVKLDLVDVAQDAAWLLYKDGILPNERECIKKVTDRRPKIEEVVYWRKMFETEYELLSKEVA
jgi:hypothetical protein